MIIFPATDVKNGLAVRLKRGDFAQMKIYGDPVEFALKFKAQGAEYLHTVDLDGAGGTGDNCGVIADIIAKSGLKVQVGGGIRSRDRIEKYLSAGAFRVILGTAAATDEAFLTETLSEYGEKVAVGVDLKDGYVAVRGWRETIPVTAEKYFDKLSALGCKTVICTDISKDGLLGGTNLSLYEELNRKYHIDIIASGGVTAVEEIIKLKKMNVYGAILGAALYENRLTVEEAVRAAK